MGTGFLNPKGIWILIKERAYNEPEVIATPDQEEYALALLQSLLDTTLLRNLFFIKRANELWITLKRKFVKTDAMAKANLLRKASDLSKFDDTADVLKRFDELKAVYNEMESIGMSNTQYNQFWQVFPQLPEKYDIP